MYRYLFEENCFSRAFGVSKKIDMSYVKRFKDVLAKDLELEYDDIEICYYKNTKEGKDIKLQTTKKIAKNFVFRVIVEISEKGNTIISLDTYISRVVPVYLVGIKYMEDIVYNLMQEFYKKSFYQDLMSNYKLKYEEVSKKIYESLEALFGFGDIFEREESFKERKTGEGKTERKGESEGTGEGTGKKEKGTEETKEESKERGTQTEEDSKEKPKEDKERKKEPPESPYEEKPTETRKKEEKSKGEQNTEEKSE